MTGGLGDAVRLERASWPGDAEKLGFRANSNGFWVKDGSVLEHDAGWLTVRGMRSYPGDPLRELPGTPALWCARRGRGRASDAIWRTFDLPPLRELEPDPDDWRSTPLKLLHWSQSTDPRMGFPNSRNGLPPLDEIESWLPAERRLIRAGGQVAQVEIETGSRLALSIPRLVGIPDGLPAARLAWVEEVCHSAHERWRMARFGIDDEEGCVCAEVDLSFAPPTLVRALFELGLAALSRAVRGSLPALTAAADPGVESQLLDRAPRWAAPRRRGRRNDRNENENKRTETEKGVSA